MEHRAGPILANRSLSALILVSFVLSAFAGLYIVASPPPSAAQVPIGDLTITSGTYTIENIEQPVDGDVEVSGGELIVRNGALMVISTVGNPRHVTVSGSGTLTLEHGVLTSYLNQIDPWPFLTLTVTDGGTVMATDASILSFPGFIYIQNGGELILYNSSIEQIPDEDLVQYIGGSTDVTMDSADDGPAIMVNDATLMMFDSSITDMPEFETDLNIASNLTVSDHSTLLAVDSYIDVDFGPVESFADWYSHNMLVLNGLSNAYLYGCHFKPYSGELSARAYSISTTVDSDAYIYRWLSVTVGDEYGVPIPDAEIDAVFTGSLELEGEPLVYYTPTGPSSTPPAEVLDYMGETVESIFITKSDGVAQIPFLTDIVTFGESGYVGSFEITGSTTVGVDIYSSTETFSFPAYPAMTLDDQEFEMTVDVEGISAESPDTARWLVVPPDLLIENMEYYHAGDVIVASDGTLTLRNAVFRVVQAYPNERTIYVDGTANFVVEDSQIVSDLPVNIIVKGSGTLEITNSYLIGVSIVAMDDAEIVLNGVSADGSITTSWDSEAHIAIFDSLLYQSPELSGSTVCEITNTSAPSIIVLDSAMAFIYRWIHIVIFDGGDYPLEGANVYARFYVNETFWTSSTTDSSGIARLKSLGTVLTSTGSTYVGQYRVNASYWSDGVEHVSDEEVSVSVLPYTAPLTENATFAVLTISSVMLPDLAVSSDEFWVDPPDVVLDTECAIIVRVWNNGEVQADNVTVDFYVGEVLETAEFIDTYSTDVVSAGSFEDVSVLWTPDTIGEHTLWVVVNDGAVFDERTFANNNASIVVDALNYADLGVGPLEFYPAGLAEAVTSIAGGEDIVVRSVMTNHGEAPISDFTVRMTVSYGATVEPFYETITAVMEQEDTYLLEFAYHVPTVTDTTEFDFQIAANPALLVAETTYANNNESATLTVLDIREDYKVSIEDVYVLYGVDNTTNPVYGRTVTIVANIYNLGGTNPGNVSIEFGMSLYPDTPIAIVNISVEPRMSRDARANFLINITDGDTYSLYVMADSEHLYTEKNETNNYMEFDFVIEQLEVDYEVSGLATEYEAEDTIVVDVIIKYAGTETPVPLLRGVSVQLRSGSTVIATADDVYTTAEGTASFSLGIPPEIESGTYSIVCMVTGLGESEAESIEIHGTVSGGGIPLLVWIVVIGAIAAVVIGFTAYTYVYGLGKLVECGECGEFIPAASKRCPKCGVEFEVGTMKCSECGAWVPSESSECPNCGVKFVGEEIGEEDYLENMRKEYDEMVSKYRELAKAELGKKFSDKKFEEWWVTQPTYISFDDWLAKEEEKRKEGPIACPVCGTLNPKEATVCSKCGTVFGAAKGPPEGGQMPPSPPSAGAEPAPSLVVSQAQPPVESGQPPQAAPKMVIRRPIDRKVVPKKIIKTPISRDGSGGEGTENNEEQQ